jgi:hypothetical protein
MSAARARLCAFADDCEARARQAITGEAKSSYQRAAIAARRDAGALHIGERGMELALAAARATSDFARYLDGETIDARPSVPIVDAPQTVRQEAPPTRRGLNARQLARLVGMSERGALKRIVHGFDRDLPGFYRDGRRWFADPAAFDQFRMSSD